MVALPYPSLRRSSGGNGPSGPSYIRPVLRRIGSPDFAGWDYDEVMSTSSKTKASLVVIAQAAAPGIPSGAFGFEYFIIAPGGPGFSGSGFGGLPGSTRRGVIPFDMIPDGGSIHFEIGAPGLGQAGGRGYAGGFSGIYTSNNSVQIYAEGGPAGAGSVDEQRALNQWVALNDVVISDIAQTSWPGIQPLGPCSPTGPGGGAPSNYDTNLYSPYGGYGARPPDPMYSCGDGGNPGSLEYDDAGGDGIMPGGGGGAGGPSHPGGAGAASFIRYAIVYWEPVNG